MAERKGWRGRLKVEAPYLRVKLRPFRPSCKCLLSGNHSSFNKTNTNYPHGEELGGLLRVNGLLPSCPSLASPPGGCFRANLRV